MIYTHRFHYLGFIKSRFFETDKGNNNGSHIEYLAKNTADRGNGDQKVVQQPEGRNNRHLRDANFLSVSRPHGKRTGDLRNQGKGDEPPRFLEYKNGNQSSRQDKAFQADNTYHGFCFFALICKRTNNIISIENKSCPSADQNELS